MQKVQDTLRLANEKLNWVQIAYRNCYARVKRLDGTEVKRVPRCFYCLKNEKK
jgi:hypothetical protein